LRDFGVVRNVSPASKTAQRASNEEILESEKLYNREVGFFHSFVWRVGFLTFPSSTFPLYTEMRLPTQWRLCNVLGGALSQDCQQGIS